MFNFVFKAAALTSGGFRIVSDTLVITYAFTLSLKKVSHLMVVNNFGKCGSIFTILSLIDSSENSLCTNHRDFHFTCNMLLQYLLKVKKKSQMLLILTASATNC